MSPLKLVPSKVPLEYVSIDILGELVRTKRGFQYLLVMTDRFSKLPRTVPLKRIAAAAIAQAFIKDWVYVYGPPLNMLSDNGKQLVPKFFQNACRIFGVKNVFSTKYHPQTNWQVERFNRTFVAALRPYVSDSPRNWYLYTNTLCYAYNTKMHSTTRMEAFDLVLAHPPLALPVVLDQETTSDTPKPASHHLKWRDDLKQRAEQAARELAKVQARNKRNTTQRCAL